MPPSKIRNASLQYWPRKRASRILPNANWNALQKSLDKQKRKEVGVEGFIGYKVGMVSIFAKDLTPESMSKNKKIILPASVVSCPKMKIYSVRFYKNGQVAKELIVNWDKDLKAKARKPGKIEKLDFAKAGDYDDLRVLVYSKISEGGYKKSSDIIELALNGSKQDKEKFIQEKVSKEISVFDVFKDGVLDIRGVTKGFGLSGPVKRFGISLKSHKSEKGVRRPGSLGPWHPARVIFKTPVSGQHGFFTRVVYNLAILKIGNVKNAKEDINEIKAGGWRHYGPISGDYILLKGSVQGPEKRPVLLTLPLRPTKKTTKQKYEFIEAR